MLFDDLKIALAKWRLTSKERAAIRDRVVRIRATAEVHDSRSLARAVQTEINATRGRVALQLAGTFSAIIEDFRADEVRRTARTAEAERHEIVAEKMAHLAASLMTLMRQSDQRFREAQRRGYLPFERRYGTLRLADVGRAPEDNLGSAVQRLATDCEIWRRWTKFIARRTRGGKPIGNRMFLAEMAGLHLARAGVKLAMTQGGVFEKVLRTLYKDAGLSPTLAYRDVCRVLRDVSLKPLLHS